MNQKNVSATLYPSATNISEEDEPVTLVTCGYFVPERNLQSE